MPPTRACARSPVWVSGWVPGNTAGDGSAACDAVTIMSGNRQDRSRHRTRENRDVISEGVSTNNQGNRATSGKRWTGP